MPAFNFYGNPELEEYEEDQMVPVEIDPTEKQAQGLLKVGAIPAGKRPEFDLGAEVEKIQATAPYQSVLKGLKDQENLNRIDIENAPRQQVDYTPLQEGLNYFRSMTVPNASPIGAVKAPRDQSEYFNKIDERTGELSKKRQELLKLASDSALAKKRSEDLLAYRQGLLNRPRAGAGVRPLSEVGQIQLLKDAREATKGPAEIIDAVNEVDLLLKSVGGLRGYQSSMGEIPGLAPFTKAKGLAQDVLGTVIPSAKRSDQEVALEQAYSAISNNFAHEKYGAAFTPTEQRRFARELADAAEKGTAAKINALLRVAEAARMKAERGLVPIKTRQGIFEQHLAEGGINPDSIPAYRQSGQKEKVPGAPPVGTRNGNYEFMGGNHRDAKNWKKVQ